MSYLLYQQGQQYQLSLHFTSQLFGSEDCYLWLVASWDRRVSVWSADWKRDLCQLVDWLTFPGPSFAPDGTRLRRGHKVLKPRPAVCKKISEFEEIF